MQYKHVRKIQNYSLIIWLLIFVILKLFIAANPTCIITGVSLKGCLLVGIDISAKLNLFNWVWIPIFVLIATVKFFTVIAVKLSELEKNKI